MAIRDRWNRITRRSGSSASSGGRTDDSQTDIASSTTACSSTAPTLNAPAAPARSHFRLAKVTSWRAVTTTTAHAAGRTGGPSPPPPQQQQHTNKTTITTTMDFSSFPSRGEKPTTALPFRKKKQQQQGASINPRRLRQTWQHPSERPLTEQNLRHQEMLGMFTMKFGRRRRLSSGARSSFSGVSPGNSRPVSLDLGRITSSSTTAFGQGECGPHEQRRMSSFGVGLWE